MGISFSLPPLDWHTFLGHKSVKKSDFSIIRVKGLGLKNYFFKGHVNCFCNLLSYTLSNVLFLFFSEIHLFWKGLTKEAKKGPNGL